MNFKNLSVRKMYALIRNCVRDSVPFRFDIYEKPNYYQFNIYIAGNLYFHVFDSVHYNEYCRLFKFASLYEKKS